MTTAGPSESNKLAAADQGPSDGALRLSSMRRSKPRWRQQLSQFLNNTNTIIGLVLLIIIVLMALGAPLLTWYSPIETNTQERLEGPSLNHPLGTDQLGRDIWSRVLHGGRLSLPAGFVAVGISLLGGVFFGLVAGFYGRWVDMLIMRLADVLMAMPGILLTMIFIFSFGPTLTNTMIAIGLAQIPDYARLVRGSVLSAREHVYVEAAQVSGARSARIMFKHILPNVVAPVLVVATLGLGFAILTLAGLSFLGLGAQPPQPEWGVLVSEGRERLRTAWWMTTFPGIAIALAVLSINLVGDGLRDVLDPRTRSR
jgi:peptide/nickel transport system permease protein